MKINKENDLLKNKRKKLGILALATSAAILMSGCGKSNKTVSEEVGYLVETENLEDYNGLYSYIIDVNGLESKKQDYTSGLSSIEPKNFAKVIDTKEYGTDFSNEMSSAFYWKNIIIVWPDCYSLYNNNFYKGTASFDYDLKIETLQEYFGEKYTVVYSSATAKKDLKLGDAYLLTDDKKALYKGDNMSSIAIYKDNELIAYKQTGVGSDCKNVKESLKGNVDLALSTVKDSGLLSETKEITYDDLYVQQEELNNQKIKK